MPESALLTTRSIGIWTIAACLIAAAVFAKGASLARADQADPGQGLGSVDEYEQTATPSAEDYESPELGLAVRNETEWLDQSEWLKHGRWISGVEILKVAPGSPGDVAGLQGSRPGALQMTLLMTGFIASAFFPPVMMGMIALSKTTEAHEMVIAVDGKRTCDVIDFEEALANTAAGEMVYLTVIRRDRREQIRLDLPVQ